MDDRKHPLDYAEVGPQPSPVAIVVRVVVVMASTLFGLAGAACILFGLSALQYASGSEAFSPEGIIEAVILVLMGAVLLALAYRRFRSVLGRR